MSSNITLSAATRQNLLSLQDTASLLSTTQSRLSTGKKVNSALDNPVNFFTAQSLNSRSSDLSALLDGIGNGIQALQAADKGLTSLSKLTDQLKSTATQALSAASGYTAKATLTSTGLTGAVDTNLLSTGPTQAAGTAIGSSAATRGIKTGTVDVSTTALITTQLGAGKSFQIDGVDINLKDTGSYTTASLAAEISNQLSAGGSSASVAASGSNLAITGSTDGAAISITGADAAALFGATPANTTANVFKPALTSKVAALGFADGDSFSVNGYNVSVTKNDTIATLAQKVVVATNGEVKASFSESTRQFTFEAKDAKTSVNLGNGSTSTALVANLGYSTTQFASGKGNGTASPLLGDVLTVKVGTGDKAKTASVSFGTAAGQISTLDQLNAKLAEANAQASIDANGKISITTTNDAGSQDLTLSGSATGTGNTFLSTSAKPTIGGDGLTARNRFVSDYNDLLAQIDQLSNDSGYNGVNLLKGDQFKISFNAEQTSSITVKGKTTSAETLGLKAVTSEDFKDNSSINQVFSSIKSASDSLKSLSSTYASNLSVVQNRQEFSKNIINVLDTGAANLTNADMNEEAANSQALSTRNSLAISALSLANQSQQGILQLLR